MERYIGIDVHAASCTVAVISETGKKLKDFPVETNGHALVEAIRMIPGHKHLVFEEGLQSAWLYETLRPHVDEIVVAGVSQSRGQKDDKRDAYGWKFPHQNAGNPRYCRPDTKVSSGNLKEKPISRQRHGEARLLRALVPYMHNNWRVLLFRVLRFRKERFLGASGSLIGHQRVT